MIWFHKRTSLRKIALLCSILSAVLGPKPAALPQQLQASPWSTLDTSEGPEPSRHNGIWKVVPSEYRAWYIRNDSTIWGYNNSSPYPVQFPIGGRKALTGAGGFNYFRVLDDLGYCWTSKTDYTTNTARTDKDTTGAAFNGNWYVDAYAHTCITIRSDSSVWYFGVDAFSLFYPRGDLVLMTGSTMAPTQLSPRGMRFKKVLFGGNKILGLTTNGQVYEWLAGAGRTPAKMILPRPASDIFASHLDLAGCIIPDPGGSRKMGYPYVWGIITGLYGGKTTFTQPTSIKTLWKMTVPIKEITTSSNTIHYIDSLGRLFGIGFNSPGEIGNGREFVNKFTYPHFPAYAWTYIDYENPSGAPPDQIGAGIAWKHLYSNNWFTLYTYAQDADGNLYSWGRNKSGVLGNGLVNIDDRFSPDALDVLTPTRVHPLSARFQTYHFTAPVISAGPDQVTSDATVLLNGSATPPLLITTTPVAANGLDTVRYKIVSWKWTRAKGAAAKISSPSTASTKVTGMTPGIYIFNLQTTDNNTGTQSANVTITVKAEASAKK